MILIVPHHKTRKEAIALIAADDDLFSGAAGGSVEIVDQQKEWEGSSMAFSFVGRVGFISVPVSGTLEVDEVNVTVTSELPSMVRNFVGEEKVAAGIEKQLRRLL
jgi:hypothetical protein